MASRLWDDRASGDAFSMEVDDGFGPEKSENVCQGWTMARVIQHVFCSGSGDFDAATCDEPICSERKNLNLHNLGQFIENELEDGSNVDLESLESLEDDNGRLGPKKVTFDVSTNVGSFVIDRDRLGVSSQSNFSSIRANVCVYKGRWQYELMLGSKGVMQLGWATVRCKFSQEKGVGDTPESFAYDGNRVRKWNVATYRYGESWLTGDVIGCTMDMDNGCVHFYRNGKCLGEAFGNVRTGPGVAYFPAVSLAFGENLVANFGAVPFKYPVAGYLPLHEPKWKDVQKAEKCFYWLGKLIPLYDTPQPPQSIGGDRSSKESSGDAPPVLVTRDTMLMLVAVDVFHHLGPCLMSPYVTEANLVPFLMRLREEDERAKEGLRDREPLFRCLDLFWSLLEDHELHRCLENLVVSLLTSYRFAPATLELEHQKKQLTLTMNVLRHESTRKFLLQKVLFDKIKFPVFLHVKPLDNTGLEAAIPLVWWEGSEKHFEPQRRVAYLCSIVRVQQAVFELEALQVNLLKVLLDDTDGRGQDSGPSSRAIFLSKFREFLKENMINSRIHPRHLCPLPVMLCFFHRLTRALRQLYGEAASEETYVPVRCFVDDSINYFEIQRLGGLISHLRKILKGDIANVLQQTTTTDGTSQVEPSRNVSADAGAVAMETDEPAVRPAGDVACCDSLVEILDGAILLYQMAAHKQLAKMFAVKESMQEYASALASTDAKIERCKQEDAGGETLASLLHSKEVFLEKLSELSRHMGWIRGIVYGKDKQEDLFWVLRSVLRTLEKASAEGPLLATVPDFYVEVAVNSCGALRNFFPRTESVPGFRETLINVGLFLSSHFADKRIVSADVKDTLIQALAALVCQPPTLKALEAMPHESRVAMVKRLLKPYENRAWAQSNWILVRFWKGCGYAFRYTQPPHLAARLGPKTQQSDTTLPNPFYKPCPSALFQNHVATVLLEDPDAANTFLNSVLNQLNWAFSEFIGMLQEIQNASNRPERVFIDSRQLKICATCFDLAIALLRVLEMVAHVVPQLFTDRNRPSSDLILARLCQLLCQVLNRVASRSSCFDHVVSLEIPGLETVDHFPVVAAVTGILVRLLLEGAPESRDCAALALLAEPSFQLSSVEFLVGRSGLSRPAGYQFAATREPFTLSHYEDDVSAEEIHQVERLLEFLRTQQESVDATAKVSCDDDLCPICYAHPISAKFVPCGHHSCRACISHQLMNKAECFFCKAAITEVVDSFTGRTLHDITSPKRTPKPPPPPSPGSLES